VFGYQISAASRLNIDLSCRRFGGHEIRVFHGIRGCKWQRQFSLEFKLEAIPLVKECAVSVVQASRDLDVGDPVPRHWIKEPDIPSRAGVAGSGPALAGAAGD
jgi:transposase-like protein